MSGHHGAPPPLTLHRRIVRGELLHRGAGADYHALDAGEGEPHLVREELLPGSTALWNAGGLRRPLLCMAHVTDLQLADVQSPVRFEFFNRQYTDPRFAALVPVQRPQEAFTPHAVLSMVETLNRIAASPTTGAPIDLAVTTGDVIDNAQWNELQAFLALFNGGPVRHRSGGDRYEGVQSTDWPDSVFWRPDGPPDPTGRPTCSGRCSAFRTCRAPSNERSTRCTPRTLRALAGLLRQPRGTDPGRRRRHRAGRRGAGRQPQARRPADRRRPRPGARDVHRRPARLPRRGRPRDHGRPRAPSGHPPRLRAGAPARRRPPRRARVHRRERADGHGLLRVRPARRPAHRPRHDPRHRGGDRRPRHRPDVVAPGAAHRGALALPGRRRHHDDDARRGPARRRLRPPRHRHADQRARGPHRGRVRGLGRRRTGGRPGAPRSAAPVPQRGAVAQRAHPHERRPAARRPPRPAPRLLGGHQTSAIVDWPCQTRLVELVDLGGGAMAVACTMVDHDTPLGPLAPGGILDGAGLTTAQLASLHRELAANMPTVGVGSRLEGTPTDRNVVLPLRAPFDLTRLPPR